MLAFLVFACSPSPVDPCADLQDAIETCGFAVDDYECERGDDNPDTELLACMADYIAAEGCIRGADAYTDLTVPAFEACS